jgi:hypothetical protein
MKREEGMRKGRRRRNRSGTIEVGKRKKLQ